MILSNVDQPILPESIYRLEEIAHNLWWSWSPEAREVFRAMSVTLWRRTDHNPVRMLREISPDRLASLANDKEFLKKYKTLCKTFDAAMAKSDAKVEAIAPKMVGKKVAYFSAEYGLHPSLPIYSGGLGILAGDHAKTASDIGLDLTAVGFMYPRGYFVQHITSDGVQEASYDVISIPNTPIEHAILTTGEHAIVSLPLESPDDLLHLQTWLVRCGRVKMYLLDSDLDTNMPSNRDITTRLYGGDREYRLRQEIALGIGGVRVMHLLGLLPDVWHANEGHVAFMLLERLRILVRGGQSFEEARAHVRKTSIFTTHTPVPAGHDTFSFELMDRYFWHYWQELGIDREQFLDLGRHKDESGNESFNMTVLSLNLSDQRNAVSVKHCEVTQEMWPEYVLPPNKITSVTNGIHVHTWIAPEMCSLFENHVDSDWEANLTNKNFWKKIHHVPDEVFWNTRQQMKLSLFNLITDLVRRKWMDGGFSTELFIPSGTLLDPSVLTIGFARRFATYKRATLLFHDVDRLRRLLTDPERPVQFVFSGKAHPADEGGKALIKQIYDFAKDPMFAGRISFLENYGMHTAKYLVRGVDLWMNTPKAPLEASGTSGMKAAINGVPNFSILDGWWIEGWNGKNGWGIEGATEGTPEEQDALDADHMYRILEQEIVPLYYDRATDGIPHGWLKVAKESIATLLPEFSSERMLADYMKHLYSHSQPAIAKATRKPR